MAVAPVFIGTPRIGRCSIAAQNTNTDGTGVIVDLITGASTGTRILEVVTKGTLQTAAGIIRLFTFDGTNWDLYDEFTIAAVTGGNTTQTNRNNRTYQNLVLPNASWKLGVTLSVATVSGTIRCFAFGGDL